MASDTNVTQLIINRLSNEQYETAVKSDTELWLTPELPASTTNLGPVKVDGTTITADADGTIHGNAQVTIDSALSTTSTNPVQNKVITTNMVKGVTGSGATITVTKGDDTTSTITVNNVANATEATKVTTQAGTSDSNRVVFFAHASDTKQIVYDTDFQYNPSTNKLTVENVNSTKVSVGGSEQATMQYNATTQSIDFVFA